MSDGEFRYALVGCGDISHFHGRAARNSQADIRFVACCDMVAERAERWAQTFGCDAAYTDYEKMIREHQPDAVFLATWPTGHREQIEQCLNAGAKNILSEKALAASAEDALAIWRMALDADARVMEGFMYRHHPSIAYLARRIADGAVGEIDAIRATFSAFDPENVDPNDESRNWRQRRECGGGVPYDLACYCVNACSFFAGDLPLRVFCVGDTHETLGLINRMYAMIEYANGVVGEVESSKLADMSQELLLVGAKGRLRLPVSWTQYESVDVTETHCTGWVAYDTTLHQVPAADSYQLQLEHFADACRERAPQRVPLAESVVNAHIIDAMIASMETHEAREVQLSGDLVDDLKRSRENRS